MTPADVDRLLRPLTIKDLRLLCRGRALNPAGGKEQLEDRLKQHMLSTGNFSTQVPGEGPEQPTPPGYAVAPQGYQQYTTGVNNNNYSRPGGQQNVGNFITDRPSSHVTAPPGGHSSVQLGGYTEPQPAGHYQQPPPMLQAPYASSMQNANAYGATSGDVRGGSLANNYSRPGGQQNVGNFITDRPSSRVLAPPGGTSQISFGDYGAQPPPSHNVGHGAPYSGPAPPYGVSAPQQHGYGHGSPVVVGPDGRPVTAGE
ncbi:hypothetical protein VOLCADRAFT_121666 [Volvox carteri f. nagariensis]|uniref:SAP domain-containing protein n=1 Tax=Volvox carteri f. nagariensis TaxID=3068 RepID=D8UH91_VOLCA|nr:uncharacterized protein VOLCADRAFT_121666 [Volvox carteri f. nagariensis]EFJ40864.1 hypothetical protein VOLCADRAFT_121666 [Volvox carteri f. nagariensis]|eukprot:XP_002958024.1 hypothetical protein VOLCADRAFT_121666 [Volvox carteri f. nagariensis]